MKLNEPADRGNSGRLLVYASPHRLFLTLSPLFLLSVMMYDVALHVSPIGRLVENTEDVCTWIDTMGQLSSPSSPKLTWC